MGLALLPHLRPMGLYLPTVPGIKRTSRTPGEHRPSSEKHLQGRRLDSSPRAIVSSPIPFLPQFTICDRVMSNMGTWWAAWHWGLFCPAFSWTLRFLCAVRVCALPVSVLLFFPALLLGRFSIGFLSQFALNLHVLRGSGNPQLSASGHFLSPYAPVAHRPHPSPHATPLASALLPSSSHLLFEQSQRCPSFAAEKCQVLSRSLTLKVSQCQCSDRVPSLIRANLICGLISV